MALTYGTTAVVTYATRARNTKEVSRGLANGRSVDRRHHRRDGGAEHTYRGTVFEEVTTT